jgi:hypothetical protein
MALDSLEHGHTLHPWKLRHPPIMLLMNAVLDNTLVAIGGLLRLQRPAVSAHAAFCVVHCFLQRVVFPAEDVVAVLAVACVVACGEVEGLGAVGGPVGFCVEVRCVPYDLEEVSMRMKRMGGRGEGRVG